MTGNSPTDLVTEAFPADVAPMLATAGPLPGDGAGWAFETKWDGIRAIVAIERGRVGIRTRTGNDVSDQFPELSALGSAVDGHSVVLDGEVVAFGADGLPSFHQLQHRLGLSRSAAALRSRTIPVLYVYFDLLHLDGVSTRPLALRDRRKLLTQLDIEDGPAWRESGLHLDGAVLHGVTREAGLEGVVAKQLDSPYLPGTRSRSWIKVKHLHIDDFVIGGWVPGDGRRLSSIGALLLGQRVSDSPGEQRLHWVGRVGTGFTDAELAELRRRLAALVTDASPFDRPVDDRRAVYVRPVLTARVEYQAFTPDGLLRFASFQHLVDE